MALKTDELIVVHTPHLVDKYKGTRMIIDMLREYDRIDPGRVVIDHIEEHTAALAREEGFWCGMTLYPVTKFTASRAADIIETYGDDRMLVNSSGDWGPSDPLAVPNFMQELRRRGHSQTKIKKIVYDNPLEFLSQARNFQFTSPGALT